MVIICGLFVVWTFAVVGGWCGCRERSDPELHLNQVLTLKADFNIGLIIIWSARETSYRVSYFQELVSQCLPHAAAVLWALLCVCGASVEHLHPRDRLRKKDKSSFCISLPSSTGTQGHTEREELTAVMLDVVDSNIGGYKWCAVVFFLVPLLCQQLSLCFLCEYNILDFRTRKIITEESINKQGRKCRS